MPYIPFFSRLSIVEYEGLAIATLIFIVERLLRIVLLIFPAQLVSGYLPASLLKILGGPDTKDPHKAQDALDIYEIVEKWKYRCEDHLVETKDGFILAIHHIARSRESLKTSQPLNGEPQKGKKLKRRPVVLLWHGFMMNSELWVSHPNIDNLLPFRLVDAGYDVWLGNNRGNKYSYKHTKLKPHQTEFWDFSIDETALIDIPLVVETILGVTHQESLTYIGFSQGTAQMFAALSRNPKLNSQINHFIALAPAFTPKGQSLQMYDDRSSVFPITGPSQRPLGHHTPVYPLNKISAKISIFHGLNDTLSSIEVLLKQLERSPNICKAIAHYEHLDFVWADDVGDLVFTPLLKILETDDRDTATNTLRSDNLKDPFDAYNDKAWLYYDGRMTKGPPKGYEDESGDAFQKTDTESSSPTATIPRHKSLPYISASPPKYLSYRPRPRGRNVDKLVTMFSSPSPSPSPTPSINDVPTVRELPHTTQKKAEGEETLY
ncbi:hypothetical protein H4219_005773 [Mycoemilia scoparia]|uniref:Partial AB-hydrolase lipase domain-containing protein n=1 Tax=Mycoemilia scoparia TaxID=417184 RepID=A0A9W7ZLG6_9FUNG|nr:hypothetical protein H4219_005773 [Mycoemilia scoparia]